MSSVSRLVSAVRSRMVAAAGVCPRSRGGSSARTGRPVDRIGVLSARGVGLAGGLVGVVAAVCCVLVVGVGPAFADSCPNAQYRTGYSAQLPDCRAYEMVTPPGAEPNKNIALRASASGAGFSYFSYLVPAGVESFGNYFLSSRGGSGWSTEGVIPPQAAVDHVLCIPPIVFWSEDFSRGLLADGPDSTATQGGRCPGDDPPLVAGEPRGYQNLFIADPAAGTYQLVNVTPQGVEPNFAYPQAVSGDLGHVAFDEGAQLTPDAPPIADRSNPDDTNLYIWSGGTVRLVTVLPDGTPVQGQIGSAFLESNLTGGEDSNGNPQATHALSNDGSRVFFQADGNLYLREHPDQPQSPISGGVCTVAVDACTVQVDASQASGAGGGGGFMWATPDGSQVFFTDDASAGLTADTVSGSGQNLYRYDVATGALTDLTPGADAGVLGVSGASDDGAYVYFVADGVLTNAPNSQDDTATVGQPNLYLWHAGTATFIARLSTFDPGSLNVPRDRCTWRPNCLSARVSSSGRFLAFYSIESLTGYDNVPADPTACDFGQGDGSPCAEIYLYDAATNALRCASCDPSGAAPTGPVWIDDARHTPIRIVEHFPFTLSRDLSADGRVFFASPDALVPGDVNGQPDVYEYAGGRLSLISSGTSSDASQFADASASGDDVFFITDQALVSQDTDNGHTVYDARVGGGFPPPPPPAPPCSGDACQGPLQGPSAAPTAASVGFSGPGNATPGGAPVRARVLTRTVRGPAFVVKVRVPGAGRITIAGAGIRRGSRQVSKAGTYRLRVALTSRARAALARKRKLTLRLRVRYAPASGAAYAAAVRLTVKPASRRHARVEHRAIRPRAASHDRGGAR